MSENIGWHGHPGHRVSTAATGNKEEDSDSRVLCEDGPNEASPPLGFLAAWGPDILDQTSWPVRCWFLFHVFHPVPVAVLKFEAGRNQERPMIAGFKIKCFKNGSWACWARLCWNLRQDWNLEQCVQYLGLYILLAIGCACWNLRQDWNQGRPVIAGSKKGCVNDDSSWRCLYGNMALLGSWSSLCSTWGDSIIAGERQEMSVSFSTAVLQAVLIHNREAEAGIEQRISWEQQTASHTWEKLKNKGYTMFIFGPQAARESWLDQLSPGGNIVLAWSFDSHYNAERRRGQKCSTLHGILPFPDKRAC
eukprot:1161261-Pelagomonas_calceolata.AAC.1